MEEQLPKKDGPEAPAAAPLGDPQAGLAQSFAHELQELGLLEFAEEVNFARLTDTPGVVFPQSARAGAGPVGHNNPPPQPTQPYDLQQCHLANQATEVATARALQVLHLAKVSLHQLVTSYNPRGAASAGTDGSSKRRKTSRGAEQSGSRSGSKGLRHFSMKVCEKVEAKGRTTYNEVADELVAEMSKVEAANKNGQYDEKNIRRRVYDAINVLMAMDIIQKEKKEILWKGFPRLSHNTLDRIKAERLAKIKEVEQKQLYLQDMIEQQKALRKLLDRTASGGLNPSGTKLFLPFILVQAKPDATVEVKISEDMMDVQFDFNQSPFQIHDDSHVLKKMAEHQARQQQQQQPFGNPLAGGLGMPWQNMQGEEGGRKPGRKETGTAGNIVAAAAAAAAALTPLADPALAQLAAAAAQAQGQGSAYAAFYQQQMLQQQQAQQQTQQQQPEQAQPGHDAQQAPTQGQGQQQNQTQQAQVQQGQAAPQQQSQQLAPLNSLQALQAQLQQQQLQAQLQQQQHARLPMPGALSLPPMASLGPPSHQASQASQAFGLSHALPPHLQQASQLGEPHAGQAQQQQRQEQPQQPQRQRQQPMGLPQLPPLHTPQLSGLLPLPPLPMPQGVGQQLSLSQPVGLQGGGSVPAAPAAAFPLVA
ncbi:Transcription factor-like protein DPB [Tetrabaena socialis]|uniref:Transcription factor-like protein DPB n=1 Tax=Tetrabaena socialis TaxID=47790 RepID=A0A2J8A986_9CHLO|nr:Transcription factor-like protein DPB [Tetrabaena socialis]|eukprot:PNH09070.1 Transcription factor-like protein DPB [Tetrabaena socialis]